MRRADDGKLGRKKASRLSEEFTAEKVDELFAQRQVALDEPEPTARRRSDEEQPTTAPEVTAPSGAGNETARQDAAAQQLARQRHREALEAREKEEIARQIRLAEMESQGSDEDLELGA